METKFKFKVGDKFKLPGSETIYKLLGGPHEDGEIVVQEPDRRVRVWSTYKALEDAIVVTDATPAKRVWKVGDKFKWYEDSSDTFTVQAGPFMADEYAYTDDCDQEVFTSQLDEALPYKKPLKLYVNVYTNNTWAFAGKTLGEAQDCINRHRDCLGTAELTIDLDNLIPPPADEDEGDDE